MSIKRDLGRNIAWSTAGTAVETLAGFLIMPLLIVRLGDATYGVWIVIGALTNYFGLLDLGVRSSIGRHVAFYYSKGNRSALNQTVSGGVAVLFVVGLTAMLLVLFGQSYFFELFDVEPSHVAEASLALKLVTLQFMFYVLSSVFDATLWGFQRFDLLSFVDIPAAIVRVVVTVIFVRSDNDLAVLAAITLGVTALGAVAKCLLSFRVNSHLRLGFRYLTKLSIQELLVFGRWNLIGSIARVSRRQLSPLLIGGMLGLAMVAPFSVAERLLATVSSVLASVTTVLTPFSTSLHATDQTERQRRLFILGGKLSCALASCLIGFLLILGGPFIALWIGSRFYEYSYLLAIICIGELLPCTQGVSCGVLLATAAPGIWYFRTGRDRIGLLAHSNSHPLARFTRRRACSRDPRLLGPWRRPTDTGLQGCRSLTEDVPS